MEVSVGNTYFLNSGSVLNFILPFFLCLCVSGKSSGHDVDILFSYPDERDFDGRRFISTIRTELDKRGLVIWSRMGNVDDNTDKPTDAEFSYVTSTSDHLPMCMIILKYPLNGVFGELANKVDPGTFMIFMRHP